MKSRYKMLIAGSALAFATNSAVANEVEGRIEAIDHVDHSLIVLGIRFFATPHTDYDDGLRSFADLRVGQKVEVEFNYRGGWHYATEIELEN